MRSLMIALILVTVCFFSREASAQRAFSRWAYADFSPTGLGGQYGMNYGGTTNFGLAVGASHPYRLDAFAPEVEVYVGLMTEISTATLWVYTGGGVSIDPTDREARYSARLSLWWVDNRDVGPFFSFYGTYTPAQLGQGEGYLVQPRAGIVVKLSSLLQLIAYGQVAVVLPAADVTFAPGVTLLFTL